MHSEDSKQFMKLMLDAIIYGRNHGASEEVSESAIKHALLYVYLLNLTDTPPIPEEPVKQSGLTFKKWSDIPIAMDNEHVLVRYMESGIVKYKIYHDADGALDGLPDDAEWAKLPGLSILTK